MNNLSNRILILSGLALTLLSAGCATQQRGVAKFDPLPSAKVGAQELEPVTPRSTAELLQEANRAFDAANKAQEAGDLESAHRHYTLMLELLIEADLDPQLFYNLRNEYGHILKTATEQADLYYARARYRDWEDFDLGRWAAGNMLPLPDPIPQRVYDEIIEIQKLYPKNFQRGLNRSAKYLPLIQEEFAKAGLPPDLVWLAMVESQFYPEAKSPAGAVGMWQFMPATGKRYGLRIDSYVDDRYDWKKETQAAIAYLSDLRDQFNGNWPLAIAAYNMGEYGLERAIAMNGGDQNIWSLIETPPAANNIRLETKKFYPKLLASVLVAQNPEEYGFTFEPLPPDDTVHVAVRGSYSLDQLNARSGLPEGTLRKLNPHFIRGVTPPSGEFLVEVPREANTRFLAALKETPIITGQPSIVLASGESITYKVKRGDTLSAIAQRHGVSLDALRQANKIRSAHNLRVGEKLVIPGARSSSVRVASAASSAPAGSSPPSNAPTNAAAKTYKVKKGDTLAQIAKREGITVEQLKAWNNMGGSTRLFAGDTLRVGPPAAVTPASSSSAPAPVEEPSPAPAAEAPPVSAETPPASTTYTVQAGDTPGVIAQKHGISLNNLLASNGLTAKSVIWPGQKLVIHGEATGTNSELLRPKQSAPEPKVVTHAVQKGENASIIASKYGVSTKDLLAWNNLTAKSVLKVGDMLVIQGAPGGGAQPKRIEHVVKRGDTLSEIAQKYGVKIAELQKWNGWTKIPVLQPGNKIIIYV